MHKDQIFIAQFKEMMSNARRENLLPLFWKCWASEDKKAHVHNNSQTVFAKFIGVIRIFGKFACWRR